jgi:hypothetical protein
MGKYRLKAELNVKIQPKVLGMSGNCYTNDKKLSLRTSFDDELDEQIKWLHTTNQRRS